MPLPDILTAATAVGVAVLELDDYAGDVFEGIATGYGDLTGLAPALGFSRRRARGG